MSRALVQRSSCLPGPEGLTFLSPALSRVFSSAGASTPPPNTGGSKEIDLRSALTQCVTKVRELDPENYAWAKLLSKVIWLAESPSRSRVCRLLTIGNAADGTSCVKDSLRASCAKESGRKSVVEQLRAWHGQMEGGGADRHISPSLGRSSLSALSDQP